VRVSTPSRVVGEREWRERERARRTRQEEAFAAAMEAAGDSDGARLRSFAEARRDGIIPAGEQAWYAAWQSDPDEAPVKTRIIAGDDGTVTLRASAMVPMSVAGRGLATAVLVTLLLGGWQVARRFPLAAAAALDDAVFFCVDGRDMASLSFFDAPFELSNVNAVSTQSQLTC